jgi:hypothetical protein
LDKVSPSDFEGGALHLILIYQRNIPGIVDEQFREFGLKVFKEFVIMS